MGEVTNPFGQHAQQGQVHLESTLRVVGMEVFADGDAADRGVAVTQLSQAPLGVQTAQQG